jgi:uncharacterized membrane protein YdbT with pleckstrin-like domain
MIGYLKSLMGESEAIDLIAHQHWFLLAYAVLPEVAVLAIGLAALSWAVWSAGPLPALGYLLLLIPLASFIRDFMVWDNHCYVVTNRRVIQMIGVFNKSVIDSSLEKVNDVKLVQSFWGRLFGYGDIEILTASEMGVNRFTRISNPVRFKTAMLNAKTKLEHGQASGMADARDNARNAALLAQIESLHKEGVLTDAEYKKKKAALTK